MTLYIYILKCLPESSYRHAIGQNAGNYETHKNKYKSFVSGKARATCSNKPMRNCLSFYQFELFAYALTYA